jgi:hypothetical protein
VKEVSLSRGLVALVDDEDFAWLSQRKWCATNNGYAIRNVDHGTPDHRMLLMHRALAERWGWDLDQGTQVDHIDRNRLNNTRENLRLVTSSMNNVNSLTRRHNTSGYRGVLWSKQKRKWQARIAIQHKQYHLGFFDDPKDAHQAYCVAAARLHGKYNPHSLL